MLGCNSHSIDEISPPLSSQDIEANSLLYSEKIQPIFNARCVACHSCFNSPCQLNLTSYDGTNRGAHKENIYDFSNFEAKAPTRLYIDAHSEKQWRKKGFFSVTKSEDETPPILYHSVAALLGIESGQQKKYNSEYSRYCSSSNSLDEQERFLQKNPAGRMPFGLPRLSNDEINLIGRWQQEGAFGPNYKTLEKEFFDKHTSLQPQLNNWEQLLNQRDIKSRLSSRYIYEHLFLAHLYFKSQPQQFFRLVRSSTPHGEIKEVGTAYAFDDPKVEFFYRFRPVVNTLTHKSHIPFPLSPFKLKRWKALFYDSKWTSLPKKMPPYGKPGGNPFKTFESIPVKSRYQFFLDEAGYHVMTFIKGPVCRGQTALNVINDHFWVMFIDPNEDVFVNSPATYEKVAKTMTLPAEIQGDFNPFINFRKTYWKGLKEKYSYMTQNNITLTPSSIWNGGKRNSNSVLTIYRHHDSANIVRGLRGQMPKTIWVIDYHVFESIYYNLTAGYDVFGPILHQVNSRLFMEISRIASEDMFISFLPTQERLKVRKAWSISTPQNKNSKLKWLAEVISGDVDEKMKFDYPYLGLSVKSNITPANGVDAKTSLLTQLIQKRFSPRQVNSSTDIYDSSLSLGRTRSQRKTFDTILGNKAKGTRHLPNTILLRLKTKSGDKAFTIIQNREHYNVSMLFFESKRRRLEGDNIDILKGINTSYANLFMAVTESEFKEFAQSLIAATSKKQVNELLKKYAIARSSSEFWQHYEWFSKKSYEPLSNESGWIDLNRYMNL